MDGDGQMDPSLIGVFIKPIINNQADYTKGNRFFNPQDVIQMPAIRRFGNIALSFMQKISSGYWDLFDPTNGYTAINLKVIKLLPIDKIDKRYFFESDLIFRLGTINAVIRDIPMKALYADEVSNLKISDILLRFLSAHIRNTCKRIFYKYYLRDFSVASLELPIGLLLVLFGSVMGSVEWLSSLVNHTYASSGTVMLVSLPIIIGVQFLLSFLSYDIATQPKNPLSIDFDE